MTKEQDVYNETSYTAAGINTPPNQENCASTDLISGAVEQMMDDAEHSMFGEEKTLKKRS